MTDEEDFDAAKAGIVEAVKEEEGWTDEQLAELKKDVPIPPTEPATVDDVLMEIAELRQDFIMFRNEHFKMVEQVQNLVSSVEPYIKDIAPMIDAIANHPMLSMILGTKKGKKNGA